MTAAMAKVIAKHRPLARGCRGCGWRTPQIDLDEIEAAHADHLAAALTAALPHLADTDTAHTIERLEGEVARRDMVVSQVGEWAMVNEIAAVPLDWAGLGAILNGGDPQ